LYSIGSNEFGQLGLNDRKLDYTTAPLLVLAFKTENSEDGIVQIACGSNHNLVLTRGQEMYAWGSNNQGQCGQIIGQHEALYTPFQVLQPIKNGPLNIMQVECGENFSGFINNGEVYTFGGNEHGQLGIGYHDQMTNVTQPTRIDSDLEFRQISFGYRHILLLASNDTVWGAGLNANYELGLGGSQKSHVRYTSPVSISSLERVQVKKVMAGSFSAVINGKDELVIWGSGEFGVIKSPQKLYMNSVIFKDCKISRF
jgi:alpha-tubulin suppressor-like RCC1 family protein